MTDPIRLTKATIKETIAADNSTTSAADQKKPDVGIAASKDSFQGKQESPLFTANTNTGEVKFGDGVSGKRPPLGTDVRLQQAKSEISSYLKGERTEFLRAKEYMLGEQNKKIDEQMKEAGERADTAMNQANTGLITGIVAGSVSIGTALDNLKHVASEAKSELAHSNNPALEFRYKHFNSLLNNLQSALNPPESKALQKQANKAEIEAHRMEQAEQKSDSSSSESNAHRDKVRDAILDFLNKLHDIDPKI